MSFERDIDAWIQKTTQRLTQASRKIAFELLIRITERMPVDTGRAKANTQLSIRHRPQGSLPDKDPTGAKVLADGQSLLWGVFNLGDLIWIANNVEYIYPLEFDAHSKQAPAGMFRVSVADIVQAWPQIVAEVKR